jgi:uncharacterized membrane protein YgdD (TMEM256/DUF423 family)
MNWAFLGSLFMFLAVAAGAFGAHALKDRLPIDMLTIFETGVRYQVYHALALLAVSWLSEKWPGAGLFYAGWCFVGGILIFSGSLYILSLTGVRWWGAITPIGGLLFLTGWGLLAVGALKR